MKLYSLPGACSTACQIILLETGADFETIKVDLKEKTLPDGASYLDINPKGQVPALVLDDGTVLTEAAVILQYVADKAGRTDLLPASGSIERYQVLSWVNYIATELHKTFSPLLRPFTPEAYTEQTRTMLLPRVLGRINAQLGTTPYLAGETFSIADAYAFVILSWARVLDFPLEPWPGIISYMGRIAEREAVREAYKLVRP
ncbi:Glutathione S-transferase [Marinobacterium lacunae]|uniref:Glutathione S-transferase n=1 Tax=Marinobacterium lacunae TaxID=1232683 RepID=A0A081FX58_9GAMM|nr:glutathione transferase GstA [Marinobacterium lacunae]KEA63113.1 Glutathione S-transferase [Marinobacterium lacunae]